MPPLLRELLRPHRLTLAVLFGLILVQTLMSLAMPWPLKIILDNVVGDIPPPSWIAWLLPMMKGAAKIRMAEAAGVITVLIAVVTGIAFYISSYLTESLGQSVGNDLRVRLYHHLQELSLSYYDKNRVGTLLSTLTGDVQSIQNFASTNTLNITTDSITLVGMVVVMFFLRWDFTLIALTVTPLLALFVLRINKAVKLAVRDVRMAQSDLLSTLQEGLQSIELVQAYSRQDLAERQLRKASGDSVAAWLATRRLSAVLSPAVGLVIALCTAVVLWRGSLLILSGAMTVGALTVFLTYLTKFFQPVKDLSVMSNTIAQVSVGFERVTAICDSDKTVPERPMPKDPDPFRGEIEFENVAFGYDAERPVLSDVTFSIAPGQKVGIVGPTGSGKSTLVSLIPRFRDLDGGNIRIDGGDILDYKLYGLRSQIGFVLQETILLRGTVRDNIAFGRPDASEDEIVDAAKQANAHEFIVKMPEGYDSFIGDRGATLSGGQRQRIGIARALIRDNPILILDEPTAALDAESEELVIEALDRLMKGRTVITIAHRLSTLRTADKIIVIKDGTVAEDGSHDDLMALDGVYANLYRLQFGTHP